MKTIMVVDDDKESLFTLKVTFEDFNNEYIVITDI